jgi:hypothetical protein
VVATQVVGVSVQEVPVASHERAGRRSDACGRRVRARGAAHGAP